LLFATPESITTQQKKLSKPKTWQELTFFLTYSFGSLKTQVDLGKILEIDLDHDLI